MARLAKRKSSPKLNHSREWASANPMSRAPSTVRGRLRSRPIAAAARAMMMMSLRFCGLNSTSGAMRIPARAASPLPRAHAVDDSRLARAPLSSVRSRLSTTARIATPVRVRNMKTRSASAMAMAATITMKRCHRIFAGPMSNPPDPKKWSTERASVAGQNFPTSTRKNTIKPTVTMSCTTSGAVCRRRIRIRSSTTPTSGASTQTTRSRATTEGSSRPPSRSCSSQKVKAPSTPMAPWAKLKTPVVV